MVKLLFPKSAIFMAMIKFAEGSSTDRPTGGLAAARLQPVKFTDALKNQVRAEHAAELYKEIRDLEEQVKEKEKQNDKISKAAEEFEKETEKKSEEDIAKLFDELESASPLKMLKVNQIQKLKELVRADGERRKALHEALYDSQRSLVRALRGLVNALKTAYE